MTEPADGLLGLGFTEASDFGVESFFSSLIGTGTLDEEVFSIYLNGDSGELVLGGTNPARYIPNSIIWFNVIANVSDYLHPLDPPANGLTTWSCVPFRITGKSDCIS